MKLYPKLILDALSHVRFPGTGLDIVSEGMVEDNIRIDGNKVSFSIIFDKPNPFSKSLVKAAEQAILTYVGEDVDIKGNITTKFKDLPKPKLKSILPNVKNTIAVFSGKGGVGKSTISTNLAISLAKLGYKVGLLDADVHGPSIPKMLGVEGIMPEVNEVDGVQQIVPVEKYGIKLLSVGFFVDPEKALIWRGTMASNALKQLITDADWGELDFFIMDLPPGTGDIHLTLVQTMGITGAILVTTPQEVALADARKGANMFMQDKINIPIVGIVENMSWFTPAELPDNKYYIFGKDGGKNMADELNIELIGQIPIVQSIRECGDNGEPASCAESGLVSLYFRKLAEKVVENIYVRNETLDATQKVEIQN